ncbi:MAG: hypothetical protein SO361_01665 [Lachnospira sp.]|nr:hypothetical protein [Lachnospira sp.]
MIIANSNVSMNSRRNYSQQVSRDKASYRGSNNSFRIGLISYQQEFSQSETFFSNSVADSYDSSKKNFPESPEMIPLYNRLGVFNDSDDNHKTDLNGGESPAGTEAFSPAYRISGSASATDSVSYSYRGIARKLYLSLLDFLESLSLRGMFNDNSMHSGNSYAQTSDETPGILTMTNAASPSRWTVKTTYSSSFTEKECTTFSSTGSVKTADGRELSFNLDMSMSREYMEKHSISYVTDYSAILTDPLVINLKDNPVSVSDQSFLFDIDGDGKDETIARMNSDSGFLALDKNGDGIINDGNELFGTKTGNGFKELSEYDSDGNGWIDESDEVYEKLKVWITDENGNDKLISLKDADVGAIYLGNAKTTFNVTDDTNDLKARVRSTGVYLHEDGSAGSIQQVDF